VLESNRELVLRRLLECLARDRTKHQVAEVTSLGLVQMTRKRVGAGLLEAFSVPCECCNGRGVIITFDPEADALPSHHVHPRGAGNGGNGSRGSGGGPASPATVAARIRTDGNAPEPGPVNGQQEDSQRADGERDAAASAIPAEAPDGPAGPSRSGSGRRRRRRPAASAPAAATAPAVASAPATATASAAPGAPAAPEAPTAPAAALPEAPQAQDGAA
jgi:ribonuclease E